MTAIIFGARGQDGFYLKALLSSLDIQVTGVSRSGDFLHTDIASFDEVSSLIKKIKPTFIFQFAAESSLSHDYLFQNHKTICEGTLNILEAVKLFSPATRVFIPGSGLQFQHTGHPIHENVPFEARDPYSLSRIYSVFAARYFRQLGLNIYVGYLFHHDSLLRSERHINIKIVNAVKRICKGSTEKLEIGDVTVRKEFGYAADIVQGIWTLVNQDHVYECVIGTGKDYSIQDWVEACFGIAGLNWSEFVITPDHYTAAYKTLVSDPTTIHALGWRHKVEFHELAAILMQTL